MYHGTRHSLFFSVWLTAMLVLGFSAGCEALEGATEESAESVNPSGGGMAGTVATAVNQLRSDRGLSSLGTDPSVAANAQAAAQSNLDAYLNGSAGNQGIGFVELIHYRNGPGQGDIIPPDTVKENLYATTTSPETEGVLAADVVSQWVSSKSVGEQPGHCENMLFENHHSIGVGAATGTDPSGRSVVVISAGFVCSDCTRNIHPECL